jgi:hypothetical protein
MRSTNGTVSVAADASLRDASFRCSQPDIAIAGVSGHLPLTWQATPAEGAPPGALTASSIRWQGLTFPTPQVAVAVVDREVRFHGALPVPLGYTKSGTAEIARGSVTLAAGRVEPRIRLHLDDFGLASEEWDARAEGVNGTITIDRTGDALTAGTQECAIAELTFGELAVRDGRLRFSLMTNGHLTVI